MNSFLLFCSHYASCLEYLGNLKTNLLLDIHLHDHVETLYDQIRHKALIQYTHPFVSVDLRMMANAFKTTVAGLEKELEALITDNQIQVWLGLCYCAFCSSIVCCPTRPYTHRHPLYIYNFFGVTDLDPLLSLKIASVLLFYLFLKSSKLLVIKTGLTFLILERDRGNSFPTVLYSKHLSVFDFPLCCYNPWFGLH